MAETITWTLRTFDISTLTDYYKNPRNLTKDQFAQLKISLDKFGMIDKPVVNADAIHTVIGGHQRLRVLREEGARSVECWYPSRELDAHEVEELNIRLNKNTGGWDFDILANQWETSDLLQWGFQGYELGIPGGIDPNDEWKGMPEYGDEAKALKTIHIHFENEQDIRDFEEKYNFIIGDKVTFWFPPRKNKDLKSMAIINES